MPPSGSEVITAGSSSHSASGPLQRTLRFVQDGPGWADTSQIDWDRIKNTIRDHVNSRMPMSEGTVGAGSESDLFFSGKGRPRLRAIRNRDCI